MLPEEGGGTQQPQFLGIGEQENHIALRLWPARHHLRGIKRDGSPRRIVARTGGIGHGVIMGHQCDSGRTAI